MTDAFHKQCEEIVKASKAYLENLDACVPDVRDRALARLRELGLRPEHIDKLLRAVEAMHYAHIEMFERDDKVNVGTVRVH